MSRAIRRHHRARLKKKRRFYHGRGGQFIRPMYSEAELDRAAAKNVDTPCPCSCWMCGNPRRYRNGPRLTMQERRHLLFKAD